MIKILNDSLHARSHTIQIQTVESCFGFIAQSFIVLSQPLDEIMLFMVPPHPSREALECRFFLCDFDAGCDTGTATHIAVDSLGIWIVGFYSDNVEAMVLDQVLGYFSPRSVEFRGPMRSVAKKDYFVVGDFVDEVCEGGVGEGRKRMDICAEEICRLGKHLGGPAKGCFHEL